MSTVTVLFYHYSTGQATIQNRFCRPPILVNVAVLEETGAALANVLIIYSMR